MRRRKPPGQSKVEEYSNEKRHKAWHSSKADRRNRPLSKAIEQRSHRRKVKQVFPSQPSAVEPDTADAMTSEATTPVHELWYRYSSTAVPLAEHLRRSRSRRLRATGRHFFRYLYTPAVHREPFGRFLEDVLAGGTGDTVELARLFQDILDNSGTAYVGWPARSAWLHEFLQDEPQWEPRLRAWIARTLGSDA